MFSSRTARRLFTDNSHELFVFRLHVGSKPRLKPRGNTDSVFEGVSLPIPLSSICGGTTTTGNN